VNEHFTLAGAWQALQSRLSPRCAAQQALLAGFTANFRWWVFAIYGMGMGDASVMMYCMAQRLELALWQWAAAAHGTAER